jgi:hypothetical protein
LVNDSEYSKSTGAKPIFRSLLAVFISFPWRAVRPYPTPPPFFVGGKVPKRKSPASALALGHVCVGVCVVGVVGVCVGMVAAFILLVGSFC